MPTHNAIAGKIIPILPCSDIKKQAEFYQLLGFELTGLYTAPNAYVTLKSGTIELHFYGTKKVDPAGNPSMCYVSVDDVDAVYTSFITLLKKHTGKVPRSGVPRITKLRDLSSDRRFTLTDTGGNTLFIGSQIKSDNSVFFRSLDNAEYTKRFAVLYDVIYSKEDPGLAESMLPRYAEMTDVLSDLDKAKYLLLVLEIKRQLNQPQDDKALQVLLEAHGKEGGDWGKVKDRYLAVLGDD